MDPAVVAQAIEAAIHRSYANWADEPVAVHSWGVEN